MSKTKPLCAMCGRTEADHDKKAMRNVTPGVQVVCATFVLPVGTVDPSVHGPDERLPRILA